MIPDPRPTQRSHPPRQARIALSLALLLLAFAIGAPHLANAWGDWRCVFGWPCNPHLYAVEALSAEVGWAGGENGMILHRDARRRWRNDRAPIGTIHALHLVSPDEAWAAGSGDRLAHRRYGSWITVRFEDPAFTGWNVEDMALDRSGKRGWAVGCAHPWRTDTRYPRSATGPCAGRALQLSEDGTWRPVPLQEAAILHGLALTDDGGQDGWAVGQAGWLWRLEHGAWRANAQVGVHTWRDVDFMGSQAGWAVGDQGALMRFAQGRWHVRPSPTSAALYGVALVDEAEAWAVGDGGTILRLRQDAWVEVDSPTTANLRAVRMIGPTEGWAVGEDSTVLHFADGQWRIDEHESGRRLSAPPPPPTHLTLLDVALDDQRRPWAVGASGATLSFDGSDWNVEVPADGGGLALTGVVVLSETSAWAVGRRGTIRHFDGRSWQSVATEDGSNPDLNAIAMLDEDRGWAVGGDGAMLRFEDAIWWRVPQIVGASLEGLSLSSTETGWAVGEGGAILRLGGGRWRNFPSPTGADLRGVTTVSENLAWAVGKRGTILRFDGRSWQVEPTDGGHDLSAVAAHDARRAWAVGSTGTILRYDGMRWVPHLGPAAHGLNAIVLDEEGGWAAGDFGTLLRLNEPVATHTLDLPGRRDAVSTDLVIQNAGVSSTTLSARLVSPDPRAPYEIGYPEIAPGGSRTFWLPTIYELGVGPIAARLTGGAPIGGVSGSYSAEGKATSVGPLLGAEELVVPLAVRAYNGQDTTVQVQNLDPSVPVSVTLRLQASGNDGHALQHNYTIAAGRAIRIDLGADPEFESLPANTPVGFLGSIHLRAAQGGRIAAHAETDVRNSRLARYAYEALPPSSAGTSLLAPLFRSRFHGDTGISVANPNDAPVAVTLTYRGTVHPDNACAGFVRRHGPVLIPARSSAVFYQGAGAANVPLTGDHGLPAGCFGAATIRSEGGPVMAIVNDAGLDARGVPRTAAAYVAMRPEDGAMRLSLPRLRNRQLKVAYSTGVQLMNGGDATATATVELFDPRGTRQSGCGEACRFVIPPGGTHNLTLGFGGLGDPFRGGHGGAIVHSDEPLIGIVNDFAIDGAMDTATYNAIGVDQP